MKKLVSAVLVIAMSVMCLFSVPCSAATAVSVSGGSLRELITLLDQNMPDGTDSQAGQRDRVQVFNTVAAYVENDNSMATFISLIENMNTDGSINPDPSDPLGGTMNSIVNRLNERLAASGKSLSYYKDSLLFALDVIKGIPQNKRQAALDDFTAAQDQVDQASYVGGVFQGWAEEEKLDDDPAFQTALQNVYAEFVVPSGDGDVKLGTHGVGPNTILRLVRALQGSMMLTDAEAGSANFVLKNASSSFVSAVRENVSAHFSSINGSTDLSGEAIINEIIKAINEYDASIKADMKTVLGSSAVHLYEPYKAPTSTPTPSSGSSSSSRRDRNNTSNSTTSNIATNVATWAAPAAPEAAEAAYVYTDTEDHWAKDYIGALTKRGVFKGYADGSYKPDMSITREEIAVALTRALGLEEEAKKAAAVSFNDSTNIAAWANDAVNLMVKNGVFKGYDDGEFKPQRIISREEIVAVIIRLFRTNLSSSALDYTDKDDVGEWARGYLEKASSLSIVTGYPDGSFQPAKAITRGEAAKILYNFMHYAGLL